MKNYFLHPGIGKVLFLSVLACVCFTSNLHAQHPRLYVTAERISELQEAIKVNGSHHQQVYNAMKARADQNDWRVYDENLSDGNYNYARSWLARELSMMYLLTKDASYAQQAYDALYAVHNDPDPDNRVPESGKGLARAMVGLGFAIAYDWCYDAWSNAQRNYIKGKIMKALDNWPSFNHTNLESSHRASNWVAVCRGGELILMLAAYEESKRSSRYNNLKSWLNTHIANAYGSIGWTQEGNGYLGYGGGFLHTAMLAAQSAGEMAFEEQMAKHDFWKVIMYAGAYDEEQSCLQFGVGGKVFDQEGLASAVLNYVPTQDLPYYLYGYDRHRGVKNPAPAGEKFDHKRAGAVWALLYYPTNTSPKSPNGALSKGILDTKTGAVYFRNRWQDKNDVLLSMMGDTYFHTKAWDQAEATQLSLFAYDTRFFAGPGKNRDAQYFSTFQVDGRSDDTAEKTTGKIKHFDINGSRGYAIVGGGQKYSALGIDDLDRHLMVDFTGDKAPVLFSTLDKVRDSGTHDYAWNANLGETDANDQLPTTTGTEDGRPYFLIRGKDNSYVKGWVLSPSNAYITENDKRLQVKVDNVKNTEIWVVMAVGQGTPVVGDITGNELASVLTVEGVSVAYNSSEDRIITDVPDTAPPAQPTGLVASAVSSNSIELSWRKNTEADLARYYIYRSETSNFTPGPGTFVGESIANTYKDEDLKASTRYYYKIKAVDQWGNASVASSEVSAMTQSDTQGPAIASATVVTATRIHLLFNEDVTSQSAENKANYSISRGVTVSAASLQPDGRTIVLTTSALSEGVEYMLTAKDIKDIYGNSGQGTVAVTFFQGNRIVESFEGYTVGDLSGQGVGTGGWLAPWNNNGSRVVDVSNNPLTANGVSGGNRAVRIRNGRENGRRQFAEALKPGRDEVWISYLLRWEATDSYSNDRRVWIFNTERYWDWRYVGIDTDAASGDFILSDAYKSNTKGGPEFRPGNTVMIVARVREDQMDLWINPKSGTETPAIAHNGGWKSFEGIGLTSFKSGDDPFLMDRIIIGETFASVVAAGDVAPPPGNEAPSVSITSPVPGATFTEGETITISASANDSDGSVAKVEFYQGSTKLGEDVASPYSYRWANVAKGNYTITAVATDNLGASTTSGAIPLTVEAGGGTPSQGIYQAESYTDSFRATESTTHPGYTGSGYMDYGGQGSYVEWNTVNEGAGTVTLNFRYANGGSKNNRQCAIIVNGTNTGSLPFAPSGGWASWTTVSKTVTLQPGDNTIRVEANTSKGGPNLDKMEVNPAGPSASHAPGVLDLVDHLEIYPNPVRGELFIRPGNAKIIQVILRDGNGMVRAVLQVDDSNKLDLSMYPDGVYLLEVTTSSGTITKRIIKE